MAQDQNKEAAAPPLAALEHELLTDSVKRESISHPVGHEIDYEDDKIKNRRINRKMDIALLPLLSLLYLFNGLDRGNVGNAQTQGWLHSRGSRSERLLRRICEGFTTDIGAVADDLNFAVSIFFVTFVTFQPISAAAGRWMGPKHWMPLIMVRPKGSTFQKPWLTLSRLSVLLGHRDHLPMLDPRARFVPQPLNVRSSKLN